MTHPNAILLVLSALLLVACEPKAGPKPSKETITLTEAPTDFDFAAASKARYFEALRGYETADVRSGKKGSYAQTLSTLGRADIVANDNLLRDPRQSCGDALTSARPLADWLPDAVKNHSLVIVNEDHRRPRDRAFVQDVMETLIPLGFTHYAAETFSPFAGSSKDPFAKYGDGHYAEDPIFGRLLTYAKSEGLTLVPYEQRFEQFAPEGSDRDIQIASRETAQTNNLLSAVLTDNPTTKMIIHVGHSHVAERPIPNHSGHGETSWMAHRLKTISGIDPLTISQTACGTMAAEAVVLTRQENTKQNNVTLFTDIAIGHPPQSFSKGRPNWRRAAGDIDVNIPQDWLGQDDPIIVEARPVALPENAIPMDRVAILPGDTDVTLLLPPGSYTIEAYTESQSLGEITRVVK